MIPSMLRTPSRLSIFEIACTPHRDELADLPHAVAGGREGQRVVLDAHAPPDRDGIHVLVGQRGQLHRRVDHDTPCSSPQARRARRPPGPSRGGPRSPGGWRRGSRSPRARRPARPGKVSVGRMVMTSAVPMTLSGTSSISAPGSSTRPALTGPAANLRALGIEADRHIAVGADEVDGRFHIGERRCGRDLSERDRPHVP